MPVERKIYKFPFWKDNPIEWVCPTCERGVLSGERGSFSFHEIKESRDAHKNEDWDPDWIVYAYSCTFLCTNPQCQEVVASVGTGGVDVDPQYDEKGELKELKHYDYFQPKYFYPHLNIFKLPENTPANIKKEVHNSFELFFASPSSSLNHIRIALELILDFLKINRFKLIRKKRIYISPHERIRLIPDTYRDFQDLFFAIKWLGNTGSHSHNITIDDVMDAYDILEIILFELFEKRTKSIKKLAKQINKKRGPRNNCS
jgi:hypothetical protein